ncbi:DUF3175 domain-containing protein [Novosphingobium sp. AP12]|nr:DUF3175 domain-containing protein [Novosphingobium sp. AP12]
MSSRTRPDEDRAGDDLDKRQRKVIKDAKDELRNAFGKPVKG